MYVPKQYGESRRDACPFCKKQATTVSKDGVPVCVEHKGSALPEMKCACGSMLELKNGKFGAFYNCINCGNQRMSRVFELNDVYDTAASRPKSNSQKPFKEANQKIKDEPDRKNPREIVVRADDPIYCG
jgi:hypothetical protein